ncbi:MAG TPA: hydroxymethylglutaryl-CoA lyase [Paracoccaceae bacterium]|nr:hydroxymethylglutaryl-CoA lyase [Paracoccaceae bacterium]
MSNHVRLYEVGPRDGLQNEAKVISVADKLALICALAEAGLRDIEVGSFVSPKWVPQMSDTEKVLAGLSYANSVNYAVLVPNMKGFEAWREARATLPRIPGEIAVFVAASEGFSKANLNCTIAESLERVRPVIEAALAEGVKVRGYVSCVTDCPYDGPTAPEAVADVVARLIEIAEMPVSLGDTIGKGTPERVQAMLRAIKRHVPAERLAGHFHDTGGQALANIEASLDEGLRVFDTAVGGLGGCPYAPGAPGNVATEAVMDRLEALGYETGLDRAAIERAATIAKSMRGQA